MSMFAALGEGLAEVGGAEAATVGTEAATEGGAAAAEGTSGGFQQNLVKGLAKQAIGGSRTGSSTSQRQGAGVEQKISVAPGIKMTLPDSRAAPPTGSPEVDAVRNAAHDVAGIGGSIMNIGMAVAPLAAGL